MRCECLLAAYGQAYHVGAKAAVIDMTPSRENTIIARSGIMHDRAQELGVWSGHVAPVFAPNLIRKVVVRMVGQLDMKKDLANLGGANAD